MPAFSATIIGGILAIFVNLPLTSPDDLFANTGSIAIATFIVAIPIGRIWANLKQDLSDRTRIHSTINATLFIIAVIASFIAENILDISNVIPYVIPLAATVTITSAVLAPLIHLLPRNAQMPIAVTLAIAIIAIGITLAFLEVGFTPEPFLTLPPPPSS